MAGCAHYHIQYQGKRIVIDPLYHRPAGATPQLPVTRQDVDGIDYLLLTHAYENFATQDLVSSDFCTVGGYRPIEKKKWLP